LRSFKTTVTTPFILLRYLANSLEFNEENEGVEGCALMTIKYFLK
jgi:hypothetical protein